ncbi:NAD(P)-binding domain-containing protein [Paenibacillus aurantius]|uniref:NAD(P)-binding domain-containing protein n=1 Tax=Paenibacillus aurantius TaxID=2918900 RepID=A0AA96RFC3_9BACL|nr:NAD(P)-binding domain-containing protein [Paenibacillus aurantius]WNQ11098.1 NAD(P)-binding domain-containing protein [Paenibacillus aurantius]
MKIAIIGSGRMGGTLGRKWAEHGHAVMFGSRDPESERVLSLLKSAPRAKAGTVQEAASFGDVLVLAVPPEEVERTLGLAGDLKDKILINLTNRYDGLSADSEVIRLAPKARVVRAFHTLPWEVLANPQFGAAEATAFLSGEDSEAKEVAACLARDIGLDPVDIGGAAEMKELEAVNARLWGLLSPRYGRDYGLRILRRHAEGN